MRFPFVIIVKIALSLSLTALCNLCYGQLIVRGGPTVATISFTEDDTYDYSMVRGFGTAVGYEFNIKSPYFSVMPEISFTRKGSKEVYDTHFTIRLRSETETKIDYIEVPVLLKFQVGKGRVKPFMLAGPSIGYAIGGRFSNTTMIQDPFPTGSMKYSSRKGTVEFGEAPSGPHENELYIDNRFDWGLQAGAGLLLFDRAILDIRYAIGLKDLYDPDPSRVRVMSPGKNRVFMFSVGYRFDVSK